MHRSQSIRLFRFDDADNPLQALDVPQATYVHGYLRDLDATTILEEPNYFDRDYLSEFSAFYSLSSRGYPNICCRLHFFALDLDDATLRQALGGDLDILGCLQEAYLGFSVIRPLPRASLGRTVLRWYKDRAPQAPRIINPSRRYEVHLAGIALYVDGLAWQQQDAGVSACATVGLWTTLHSSAFDDHHAVPTTADITRSAHKFPFATRMFPSQGLNMYQIMDAIRSQRLAPIWCSGDISGDVNGFSTERFASTCASFIRSGYPVLIWGQHLAPDISAKHVICATGFREVVPPRVAAGKVNIQDASTEYIYIHDDNLGPNVRFRIVDNGMDANGNPLPVTIIPERPPYKPDDISSSPTHAYPQIRPEALFVAVHEELRSSPDALHIAGKNIAHGICGALNVVLSGNGKSPTGLTFSTRFIKLSDYLGSGLDRTLGGNSGVLAKARSALWEAVPPMSLYIGVIRIALPNSTPLLDILLDTTDTDNNSPVYAHVIFDPKISLILNWDGGKLGQPVCAY